MDEDKRRRLKAILAEEIPHNVIAKGQALLTLLDRFVQEGHTALIAEEALIVSAALQRAASNVRFIAEVTAQRRLVELATILDGAFDHHMVDYSRPSGKVWFSPFQAILVKIVLHNLFENAERAAAANAPTSADKVQQPSVRLLCSPDKEAAVLILSIENVGRLPDDLPESIRRRSGIRLVNQCLQELGGEFIGPEAAGTERVRTTVRLPLQRVGGKWIGARR